MEESIVTADAGNQYLMFTLGEENYAVNVGEIKEVLELQPLTITKVPKAPDCMAGVINVRGGVVPVIDLRLTFNMEQTTPTVDTCIIIMEVQNGEESIMVGAIADKVQEVTELSQEQIEPPPKIGTRLDSKFISAMGKYNDTFLIIIDPNVLFSEEAFEVLKEHQKRPSEDTVT